MKKSLSIILFFIFSLCILCGYSYPQSGGGASKISSKCPNPSKLFANITILTIGDINYKPCTGRTSFFYENVDFSNATVTGLTPGGGIIGGSGTLHHIPVFTAASTIGDSPNTWSGAGNDFVWSDTPATATFTMHVKPASGGVGLFTLGSNTLQLLVDESASTVAFSVPTAGGNFVAQNALADSGIYYAGTGKATILKTAAAGSVNIGDTAQAGSGAIFAVYPSLQSGLFQFLTTNHVGTIDYAGITLFAYQRTLTAGGTTGAQTINKPAGTVNFAAGASTLVVTSTVALTTSIIFANARRADATCFVAAVTPAAGSFTITMSSPCTAETSVGFLITN